MCTNIRFQQEQSCADNRFHQELIVYKHSLPIGTTSNRNYCVQTFASNRNNRVLTIVFQQEIFVAPNNTTVLQTVIIDIVNCYRSFFDYYSCMLQLLTVNQRNPIPVFFAKSEQIVHPNISTATTSTQSISAVRYRQLSKQYIFHNQ